MSPEAYKNYIYSFKSDIWSLGISVLELLAGEKPSSNLTY
jgi:serine/threonine protein kinase